jgi:hypothetical protein
MCEISLDNIQRIRFRRGEALSNEKLETEFFATVGTGPDYISAKMFACEQHWIKVDGGVTRLTEAGSAAI